MDDFFGDENVKMLSIPNEMGFPEKGDYYKTIDQRIENYGSKVAFEMQDSIKTMEPKEMNKFIAQNQHNFGANHQKTKRK